MAKNVFMAGFIALPGVAVKSQQQTNEPLDHS